MSLAQRCAMGAAASSDNTIEVRSVDEVEFVATIQGHELRIVKVGSNRPEYRAEVIHGRPRFGITVFKDGPVDDDGNIRTLFWRAPLSQKPRDQDKKLAHTLRQIQEVGVENSGWDRIFGTQQSREAFTMSVWRKNTESCVKALHEECHLLPPCTWCGLPTGSFCDGFADMGFDIIDGSKNKLWRCGAPVCTQCDKALNVCVSCSYWAGLPRHFMFAPASDGGSAGKY